jgi:hypothetical protein
MMPRSQEIILHAAPLVTGFTGFEKLQFWDFKLRRFESTILNFIWTASRTWKAMESNRFPHVFRKKKGSHF